MTDDPQPRPAIPALAGGGQRPLWSVMIPAYECADYLRQTLASVLAQDPGPELMQIEVVDDASSDEPEKVVEELGAGRVSFHRQPRNVGHIANFNTCLERSRGALVHLLHGDDCVRNGFYQTMQQPFTQHEEIGAAFCRHIYMDDEGHWQAIARLHQQAAGPFEHAAERFAALWPVQPPAIVVRRAVYEQVGGFDSRVGVAGEDIEMWVRVAAAYPVWHEPQALALYRARPGSLIAGSMRSGRNVRDARRTIDLMSGSVPPASRPTAVRAARARCAGWALKNASMLLERQDLRGVLAQGREALASDPREVARSLAVGGVRRLSNVTVEPLELGPALDPAPRPSSNRRPIARYVGSEPRPLWSVMIPAYECADYLRQTLASVLAQDPGPELMQIEVVDDASSDEPEKVVEELGAGRVSFHRQPRNVGHIANFNTCLERSRGALVHLLHGDDCVRNGFYQTMQQPFTQHEEIGAAFCRYIAMDEQGHWTNLAPLELRSAGVLPGWLGRIAVGQRLQTPSMVVRREVYEQLGGFDSRVGFAEDWAMWVKVAAHYPVAYEPEPLALYRVHTSSMTGRYLRDGENVRDLRRVIETNREQLPPELADEITRMALRETATTCLRRAQRMLGAGDAEAMWAQVREAIRSDHSPRIVASAGVVVAARAALGAVGAVRAGHARLV